MKKISFIIFILAIGSILCHPVAALYSPAYGELKPDQKKDFNSLMNDGNTWISKNNYGNAMESFEAAAKICPKDYYASAGLAQAELAEGRRTNNQELSNSGMSRLNTVSGTMLQQGVSQTSFEYNDMMAKVCQEKAAQALSEGKSNDATYYEDLANQFRGKADDAQRKTPLSPFLVPAALCAGTFLLVRRNAQNIG